MLKKLEADTLKADLAAVTALLAARTEDDDPVGWLQFSSRKADLETELARTEAAPETRAAVGLFFGGRPVLGSKGYCGEFRREGHRSLPGSVGETLRRLGVRSVLAIRGRIPTSSTSAQC